MLTNINIKNYKSIDSVNITLGPFSVLVGPNGAGKSNFIDALQFIKECLAGSIHVPIRNRGGIRAVRRISRGHPTTFSFSLGIELPSGLFAEYSFQIGSISPGVITVNREKCVVKSIVGEIDQYEIVNGEFVKPVSGVRAKIEADRLALPIVSAVSEFSPIYDYLNNMQFYNLELDKLRGLQEADSGEILRSDGGNTAAVFREIANRDPDNQEQLCQFLSKIVPGVSSVEYASLGQKETMRFKQEVKGDKFPWAFDALSMSDGTLRVLGILLSVYQINTPTLLAIEEPETSIHPAALGILVNILKMGSRKTQVLLTTHSPDILDDDAISDAEIKVVESNQGNTIITSLGINSRDLVRDGLYTYGELLRVGELESDKIDAERQKNSQFKLFNDQKK